MKKCIIAGLAFAGLMFAGCSNEIPQPATGGAGNVTFTVGLPSGMQSRSYSDGTTATSLTYAVYDLDNPEEPAYVDGVSGMTTLTDLKADINLSLVEGKKYNVVFWAESATGSPYTLNTADGTISVNTEGAAQDESRDAFFANYTFTVTGPLTKDITLTRPFAQINIGTSDLGAFEDAGGTLASSGMTVKGYATLNLLDGKVDGDLVEYTFNEAGIATSETFPVEVKDEDGNVTTYSYIAMNYILIGDEKEVVDVTWTTDNTNSPSVTFSNIPVQRNHRTNIYGALLTNSASFSVKVEKNYDEPANDKPIFVPGVDFDEDLNTYTITGPEGLMWISAEANGKAGAFKDATITLAYDLDMAGIDFTPIAKNAWFEGTFDGAGHTISNLTVSDPDCAGLLWSNRGTVKNLTLKDPNISGTFKAGAIAGDALCGDIDNCTVDGGIIVSKPRWKEENGVWKWDDGNNVGAITGYLSAEQHASITNCTVKNVQVMAYRTVGAIAGTVNQPDAVVTGNRAENCTVVANQLSPYGEKDKDADANELFGRVINGATVSDNTYENVTVTILSKPTADEPTLEVNSPLALQALGEALTTSASNLKGATITITGDIDATGVEFPAAVWGNYLTNTTIDGGNNTISNLTVTGAFLPAGVHSGLVIKDLTFENCHAKQGTVGGTAIVLSQAYGNFSMENVHVIGGSVESSWAAGGLVGQFTNEDVTLYTASFTNCSVEGVKISASGEGWIECEGVSGANAFIGACVAWYIYGGQKSFTINIDSNCKAENNEITNGENVVGGGLYGISAVLSGKPNTLIKTTIFNEGVENFPGSATEQE